ncbi:hypothetical protein D3C85_729250 [compost metagenome]
MLDGHLQAPSLHVVAADYRQFVVHRILARQVAEGAAQGGEKPGNPRSRLPSGTFRMGVDVHQATIHLAQRAVGVDGLHAGRDRFVVEHTAIHQHRLIGVLSAFQIVVEVARHEARARRPGCVARGEQVVEFAQLGGRERPRVGCRGPSGEDQRGKAVGVEIAEQVPGLAVLQAEAQQMAMLALVGHRRVMDEDRPLEATKVGHGHHQVESLALGQQRLRPGQGGAVHRAQAIEDQRTQAPAIQRRLEPARAQEHRDALAHLGIGLPRQQTLAAEAGEQGAQQRPEIPLAPHPRLGLRGQQVEHVGLLQPHAGDRHQRAIMGQGGGQGDAVDPAGRGAGDHVDDHPQGNVLAQRLKEFVVDVAGRALRLVGIVLVEAASRPGLVLAGAAGVVDLRGAHQVEDFPVDAVLVDRERHPTEEDERQPEFFLFHGQSAAGRSRGRLR